MFFAFLATSFLIASSSVSASCVHGTSLLRRQTAEGKVKISNFGYTGLQGPANWAGLTPENSACATSKVQSPINIDQTVALAKEAPKIKIDTVNSAEFENLGTTVEVIVEGTTTFAGKDFTLKQFHFHTPSEHRINDEYFPVEMHMVHEAADNSGAIAVLAVMFEMTEGTTTELLTSVTENISKIATPGTITETGKLDFAPLIKHLETTPLFQYAGSLTTPPCAEGLTFLVTKEPLPIDVKTFLALKNVVKFNSRFTQNTVGQTNLLEVGAANTARCAAPTPGLETPKTAPPTSAPPKAPTHAPMKDEHRPMYPNPAVQPPKAETPKAEPPKAETPKAEPPKAESPKVEPPKAEAPKAEPPKAEAPMHEAPKAEPPKAEAPKPEAPKAEAPKYEAPKYEAPKAEAPMHEAPKAEAPKVEKPMAKEETVMKMHSRRMVRVRRSAF